MLTRVRLPERGAKINLRKENEGEHQALRFACGSLRLGTMPNTLLICLLWWLIFWPLRAWCAGDPKGSFASRFADPPADSRIIKIIHGWPDNPAAQDALIRSLSTQGFGGVVCNVSFSEYLRSEEKWKVFWRAVEESRKAGFSLWLYDEKGYPSGTAGGQVLAGHPEWEARGLLIADAELGVEGGTVNIALPPGRLFQAAAFPVHEGKLLLNEKTDLSRTIRAGKISWTPPAAEPARGITGWRVIALTEDRLYEGTHASMNLADHIPYPNLLEAEPTRRFLELTHDAYAKCLGNDLGRWFIATFTDEPSLMSLFLKPMPYRVLPWSSTFPAEFRKRRGYEIEALLPALIAEVEVGGSGESLAVGRSAARVRYDYWRTVGELVSENFFGQIQSWCGNHNLLSGGHLLMEENLAAHVPLYGDFFRCLRRLDAPSIDCLTSIPDQVPWSIARLAASAAELEGRTVTMCETSDHSQRYRAAGDSRPVRNVTEAEIRGTCNRLLVEGIDTITSYYSFAGLSDDALRRLNDWVGRCCTSLKGGHHVSDIAVLYPIESVWARFTPARHMANDSPHALQVEALFRDISEALYAGGRDFEYIDSRAISSARIENGELVHGDLRWRVVVLPGADTLPFAAWENLGRFVKSGGVLIAVQNFPANSEGEFPSRRVEQLAADIFEPAAYEPRFKVNARGGGGLFLPRGSAGLLSSWLDRILPRDVTASAEPNPLRQTHRHVDARELYFVINDSNLPWEGKLAFHAKGEAEQWDPMNGQATLLKNVSQVPVHLEPYGGALFRVAAAVPAGRIPLGQDVSLHLAARPLPLGEPLVARGEFVREEISAVTWNHAANIREWRSSSKLTKSRVDTFLFLRFPVTGPLQLREDGFIVLDTETPDAQRTPNQLLVILHEKNGADYFCPTGRMLGGPGRERTWVRLTKFQLAGWSQDNNGRLDLADVTEIRVGWGGYHGTEGEKVEFTLAQPQACNGEWTQINAN